MGRPRKEETLTISKQEVISGTPDAKPQDQIKIEEKPKQPGAVDILTERVKILTEDLREIRQDFGMLAALLGSTFGEPLKTRAADIALKHGK